MQILALDSGWVALVKLLIDGRYEATLHFMAVDGSSVMALVNVTEDFEASVDTAHVAAANVAELLVAWSGDSGTFLRSVDPATGALGETHVVEEGDGYAPTLYPAGGYTDVELANSGGQLPSAVRISLTGGLLEAQQGLFAMADGDGYPYGHIWLWPDRAVRNHGIPPGPFSLSVSPFAFGAEPSAGQRVYEIPGSMHLTAGLAGTPTVLGIFENGVAARVLELGGAEATVRYEVAEPEGERPRIVRHRECGYGVLVDRDQPMPGEGTTGLDLHLLDDSFQRTAPIAAVSREPDGCLEAHEIAAGPQATFGVLWVDGCLDARRVHFATVRVVTE